MRKTKIVLWWHKDRGPVVDYGDHREWPKDFQELVSHIKIWFEENQRHKPIFRLSRKEK